ncbi:MAG: amidohydrolase family protein [Pseudomonadales bacterium]|nr:amidohydrolase family protein [Pseudomonadales bacterium]
MTESKTFSGLNIWDGTGIAQADAITVTGTKITWIGDKADAPKDSQQINCDGLSAIPGLIDAHVHLELNPDESKPPLRTEEHVVPLMAERAQKMAKAGITTARDLGGGAWYELSLRDAIHRGEVTGPRLVCSGQPITCPQGRGIVTSGEEKPLIWMKRKPSSRDRSITTSI